MTTFQEQLHLALENQLSYLEFSAQGGELTVQFWNSWTFLSAALAAKVLGDEARSADLYRKVIAFYAAQPPGNIEYQLLAIAHAGLGNREDAIKALNQIEEEGANLRVLQSYLVTDDPYGIYGNIHKDAGFIDAVIRLKDRDDEILAKLRYELPDLFPPDKP